MNEAIKDLLMSDNEDDIRLGILIAKQQDVPMEEINRVYINIMLHNNFLHAYLFGEYLQRNSGRIIDRSLYYFTSWK